MGGDRGLTQEVTEAGMGKSIPNNRGTEVRSAGAQRWRQGRDEEVWKAQSGDGGNEAGRMMGPWSELIGRWWWKDSNEGKGGRLLEGQR